MWDHVSGHLIDNCLIDIVIYKITVRMGDFSNDYAGRNKRYISVLQNYMEKTECIIPS